MNIEKQSKPTPIVVRAKKRAGRQSHVGSWKIAYADFVTAMMAFFLLMWISVSFNKSKLEGIAHYFNHPLMIAARGGQGSGDRDAAIRGAGTDITRTKGQVSHGHPTHGSAAAGGAHAHPALVNLAEFKGKLRGSIAKNNLLSQFKQQIIITQNKDGVLLQVIDARKHPLFSGNSTRLTPSAAKMLQALGHVLGQVPNKISIEGHTGAKPYAGPLAGYTNWDLSLDRANACRRALTAGGLDPTHMLRVVGLGAAVPLIPGHPEDPRNRRISITVLNAWAARGIMTPSGALTIK